MLSRHLLLNAVFSAALAACPLAAHADDQATAAPVSLSVPGMFGPLATNTDPFHFDAGPVGRIYVSGIASGLGLAQNNHAAGDHKTWADLDNGQVFVQKIDGPLQFYVQAGGYTQLSLGTPYLPTEKTVDNTYGFIPVAYVKFAPTDHFSILTGKLYTLIGTENTFSFQNANIERGLLWNQTNAVNRGVQVNYAQGPLSGSVALSDGFYSQKANWLSGLLTYTIDANDSITAIASGNIKRDGTATFQTPLAQNNSRIYDLNFSHTAGSWTFSPTLQYTHVPKETHIGLADSASTYGIGLTTKYKIDDHWNIAARAEYIDTTGGTNVAYGAGSNAWSFTLTPTYQYKIFFARPEVSYVRAANATSGSAFGADGDDKSQARALIETGIYFKLE